MADTRGVLLVGNGRRVQENWLPAIGLLGQRWEPVRVVARDPARLAATGDRWGVATGTDLAAAIEDRDVTTVAVSVPPREVEGVLATLLPHAEELELILDTPALPRGLSVLQGFRTVKQLEAFAAVRIAEDYLRFPQHDLARYALAGGAVGEVRSVTAVGYGYRYHGAALVRGCIGLAQNVSGRPGARMSVRGPYDTRLRLRGRYRPLTGHLRIEGTTGRIIVPGLAAMPDRKEDGVVHQLRDDAGHLVGFGLAVGTRSWQVDPPLERIRALAPFSTDDFSHCKTAGLASVLRSLDDVADISSRYGVTDAVLDQILTCPAATVTSRLTRWQPPEQL